MKKGKISYCIVGIIILFVAVVFIRLAAVISVAITNKANEKYMPMYINEERGYSSPWYKNGLHIVDEGFIDEIAKLKRTDKAVVALGSSMSRIPFNEDNAALADGYNYIFLVCGNGCYRSDRIFINLLNEEDLIDKDKIFKYEISFSTFRNTDMTIAESSIDKWGRYSVGDDLSVEKSTMLKAPLYELNKDLLRIQNVGELYFTENNFCNNYFNYEAVADSCNMEDYMKASVKDDLLFLSDKAKCVVELSPLPEGLLNTEYGKKLNTYIDDELIPFLDGEQIPYVDYRFDYDDSEFADGVHLSYNAGVSYTKKLNDDLNKIIEN